MSKTKNKEHKNTEHLKGQIKKLKSENKQLRQRLKQLTNKSHFYENIESEPKKPKKKKQTNLCEACGKGEMTLLDLGFVKFNVCKLCNNRKKVK